MAFDADDTLWNFSAAMWTALDHAIVVAVDRRPELRGRLGARDLGDGWQRLYDEHGGQPPPGERISMLRPRSFELALAELDVVDVPLVHAMADAYLAHRHGELALHAEVLDVFDQLHGRYVLGLVTNGNTDAERSGLAGRFDFRLAADDIGIRKPDRRMFTMAAAAAGCHPSELVYVGDQPDKDVAAPQAAGCRGVWLNRTGVECPPGVEPDATVTSLTELPAVLRVFDAEEAVASGAVGVGPYRRPWPDDDRLDSELLSVGDRRNVVDRYRYWREGAIVADLDQRRHPFHVAVENWRHDRNIGAVVRNANAFAASGVHIVGRRRWNRRGAMTTDRYLSVHHHDTIDELVRWAADEDLVLVGIDNVAGAEPLEGWSPPQRCVLLFGQEGPGLSPAARNACSRLHAITQYGSTRSLNAGVASGIAMYAWSRRHAGAVDP